MDQIIEEDGAAEPVPNSSSMREESSSNCEDSLYALQIQPDTQHYVSLESSMRIHTNNNHLVSVNKPQCLKCVSPLQLNSDDNKVRDFQEELDSTNLLDFQTELRVFPRSVRIPAEASYYKKCRFAHLVPCKKIPKSQGEEEYLDLSYNSFKDGDLLAACCILEREGKVHRLNVSHNLLTYRSGKVLKRIIENNFNIAQLDVSANNLGKGSASGINHIKEALVANRSSLISLNLCANHIDEQNSSSIQQMLMGNDTLLYLNLSHNNLRRKCALALRSGLAHNNTLKVLDVSWNQMGSDGSSLIFQGLTRNQTLTKLNLSMNGIDDRVSTQMISNVLKIHPALKHLDLSKNRLSDDTIKRLLRFLAKNQTLNQLSLARNALGPHAAATLLKVFRQRQLRPSSSQLDLQYVAESKLDDDMDTLTLDLSGVDVDETFLMELGELAGSGMAVHHGHILADHKTHTHKPNRELLGRWVLCMLRAAFICKNIKIVEALSAPLRRVEGNKESVVNMVISWKDFYVSLMKSGVGVKMTPYQQCNLLAFMGQERVEGGGQGQAKRQPSPHRYKRGRSKQVEPVKKSWWINVKPLLAMECVFRGSGGCPEHVEHPLIFGHELPVPAKCKNTKADKTDRPKTMKRRKKRIRRKRNFKK